MKKVLICLVDYEKNSTQGMAALREHGFEVRLNAYRGIYTPENLRADIADADAVIADTETWDEAAFSAAPKLKCLIRFGTGMNNVDLEAAKRHGVIVANTPGWNANAVAEQTVALLFGLIRHIPGLNEDTRNGKWTRIIFHELSEKTIGILGFGAIGQKSARKLSGFDARLIAYDKYPNQNAAEEIGVTMCGLEEVISASDYLLIHLPLLPETEHIINRGTIEKMKRGVFIVNTGRGPLVDEAAVSEALKSGKIAGMASDVFEKEPPAQDNPLFSCANYICSPHISGSTYENLKATGLAAASAVIDVFEGREPKNRFV